MATEPHRKFRRPRRQQQEQQQEPRTPKSQKKRLDKGIFSDGEWWCNCEPRKKLSFLETKSGSNKGKFYYRCYECNLFLWWDAARARETGLTPSKVAADPPRPKTPSMTQQALSAYGYQRTPGGGLQTEADVPLDTEFDEDDLASEAAGIQTPCPPSSKRKRDVFEEDTDEFSDLGSDEERQMVEIADQSAEKLKAQRSFATPSTNRTTDAAANLPTPSVTRTLFPGSPTTEHKRHKQVSFEDVIPASESTLDRESTMTTPTRVRSLAPPPSSPPDDGVDVTDEVMGLLQSQKVEPAVLRTIHEALSTAARRAKGIALGRDSARASLKVRDDTVASLQERIVALEDQKKMLRSQVINMKANLMKMYEDN
ncbi:hypothetical protein B0J13DRAFT_19028 [Dactylonectria estremocensis]|uniref:Zinc finger GRF-type domain-containing protein n=1 Tax=Dactylonectria estremocensis TaxID=1079267 RepID=A0A9P9JDS7_9HYPO|nr:hypothetical protein B0J13DRAFT_19028 [Dactylonectria estremocensis]